MYVKTEGKIQGKEVPPPHTHIHTHTHTFSLKVATNTIIFFSFKNARFLPTTNFIKQLTN